MVDDILAYESMFNDMLAVHMGISSDAEDKAHAIGGTPLQDARIYSRMDQSPITREQVEKFTALFNEETTWADVKQMSQENYKLVDNAYKNNSIVEDWPIEKSEGRGR